MWYRLGKWILKFRLPLLIILFASTGVMAYYASRIQLSYEFTKAIPTDNPKYQEYQAFKARFGEEAGLLVIGIETDIFKLDVFNALRKLHTDIKSVKGVEEVLSIPEAVTLIKNDTTSKL